MNSKLLENRYDFSHDGKPIIDITVEEISDLFNSFDQKSAFSKRELDQDFVDYLIDSVKELGIKDFQLRISIEKQFNMIQESSLRKAIKSYFAYLQELETIRFKKNTKKFSLLMLLGVSLLAVINKYKVPDAPEVELWMKMAQEGSVIASWVAIWEALTSLVFAWTPHFTMCNVFQKISKTEIIISNIVIRPGIIKV